MTSKKNGTEFRKELFKIIVDSNSVLESLINSFSVYPISYDPYPFDEDHIDNFDTYKKMVDTIFKPNFSINQIKESWDNISVYKNKDSKNKRIYINPLIKNLSKYSKEEQKKIVKERLKL